MADPLALQSHFVGEGVQVVLTAGAPDLRVALVVQGQVALEIFQMTLAGVGECSLQPFSLGCLCLVRMCL